MFKRKVQDDVYRFTKKLNNEGIEVNTLFNYKDKPVYSAYVTQTEQNNSTFCFHNYRKKSKTLHTVGKATSENARNYRIATFDFDSRDIWERLSQLGITLRVTNVNDYNSVFRIFQDGEEIASARMHTSRNGEKTVSIQSEEADIRLLFLVFFSLARIY